MSPTQRTLAKLRAEGWLCQVVERWNPHARVRQDLFGFIDVLAVRGPRPRIGFGYDEAETLAVQACAGASAAARVTKIADSPNIGTVRSAGWRVEVHAWRKVKVKRGGKAVTWECRAIDLS